MIDAELTRVDALFQTRITGPLTAVVDMDGTIAAFTQDSIWIAQATIPTTQAAARRSRSW